MGNLFFFQKRYFEMINMRYVIWYILSEKGDKKMYVIYLDVLRHKSLVHVELYWFTLSSLGKKLTLMVIFHCPSVWSECLCLCEYDTGLVKEMVEDVLEWRKCPTRCPIVMQDRSWKGHYQRKIKENKITTTRQKMTRTEIYPSKYILKLNLFCTILFLQFKQLSIIYHLI